MNLTAIASWVGLASGLGAVVVAALAVVHAKHSASAARESAEAARELVRIEAGRDRTRDETQRRAQAEQVAVWYGSQEGAGYEEAPDDWGGFVRNTSTLPVREVSVEFYLRTPDGDLGPRPRWHAQPLRVLPPSFEPEFFPASEEMMNTLGRPDDWAAGVAFTDSAGRRWWRNPDGGVLNEVI